MNKLCAGFLTTGLMLAGTQAFADDMSSSHMSKSAMMKDCMTKMAAKNDGSTKDQMKAACKAEMKNGMSKDSSMNSDSMKK